MNDIRLIFAGLCGFESASSDKNVVMYGEFFKFERTPFPEKKVFSRSVADMLHKTETAPFARTPFLQPNPVRNSHGDGNLGLARAGGGETHPAMCPKRWGRLEYSIVRAKACGGGQPPETHGLPEIVVWPRVGFPTFSSDVVQIGRVPIVARGRDAARCPVQNGCSIRSSLCAF